MGDDFQKVLGTNMDRTDYAGAAPSEQEFFGRIAQRETTLAALAKNADGDDALPNEEGRRYRLNLISRIDRQSPFERYVIEVWGRVQAAGWGTAEKFRIAALFGTDDNFKIAYLMAKSAFEKAEAAKLQEAYANTASLGPMVDLNVGDMGPRGAPMTGSFGRRVANAAGLYVDPDPRRMAL